MNYQIDAPGSAIRTTVKLPASKSISNRALILNALSYSAYDVENLSDCDDTNLMVKALNSNDRDFNVGAAGMLIRLSSPSAARTLAVTPHITPNTALTAANPLMHDFLCFLNQCNIQ